MKKMDIQIKITRQISKKLESLRDIYNLSSGVTSWSKYVREGLGMSSSQLAARAGKSSSRISEAEKAESDGSISIGKLREIADSLECDLHYAFIPRKKIEDIIKDQARTKAIKTITRADTHMGLENQKVTTQEEEHLDETIQDKMYSKHLWDLN
jgi:predicted DNA-binding mobile mystery protein A